MNPRRLIGSILDSLDRGDRVRKIRSRIREDWDARWLRRVSNVVHVGANTGQERDLYARHGVGVLWIEPLPSAFEILSRNIRSLPAQRAHQALLSDVAGREYLLHIASNEGASSSILEFADGKELWPTIQFTNSVPLISDTLDNVLARESRRYDALVMDTQGSELLIIRGATQSLRGFRYIQSEAADFEVYRGYPKASELIAFLASHGFAPIRKTIFAKGPKGECFDLLFAAH